MGDAPPATRLLVPPFAGTSGEGPTAQPAGSPLDALAEAQRQADALSAPVVEEAAARTGIHAGLTASEWMERISILTAWRRERQAEIHGWLGIGERISRLATRWLLVGALIIAPEHFAAAAQLLWPF